MKNRKSLLACVAAAVCLAGQILSPLGPGEVRAEGVTIPIDSVEALIQLSEGSVSDQYTKGKIFELTEDLDLSGSDFVPIASFGGTFLGNGHVISGFDWEERGSDVGLIRFVEPGGVVEKLTVKGTLKPEGKKSRIGGIAGTNRGRITGCEFAGEIAGKESVGGIAGVNEAGGLIEQCSSEGTVSGFNATGGIAGTNEGIIDNCVNRGPVNPSDLSGSEEEAVEIKLDGRLLEPEKIFHTGGIAGRSSGTIKGCVNEGPVGYPHSGYNTGGIAGMQNGCIVSSVNRGTVYGRKDTGGITGQFEPYIKIRYEEDAIQRLQNQTDMLLDQMEALGRQLEQTESDVRSDLESLQSDMKDFRSALQTEKSGYYNNTKDFLDDLDRQMGMMEDQVDTVDLSISSDEADSSWREISKASKKLRTLRQELRSAVLTDPSRAKEILAEMTELLGGIGTSAVSLPEDLKEDLSDTTGKYEEQIRDIAQSAGDCRTLVIENQNKLFDDLKQTDAQLSSRTDGIVSRSDQLFGRLDGASENTKGQIAGIREQIRAISDTVDGGLDAVTKEREGDLIQDVSDQEPGTLGNGIVTQCTNEGTVISDSNVGGIAGMIGVEFTLDPETDVNVEGETSLRIDRTAKAVVSDCVNREEIRATNDYVGGIAGRADAGALTGNRNVRDVVSESGSYAGGIAGSSVYKVSGNFSLCRVSGQDYVGGITGKGQDVSGNYAMVSLDPETAGEYRGSIAGSADGSVSGNFFVWEGTPAVNGVTYEAQATSFDYGQWQKRTEIPEELKQLSVSFYADGTLLKRVTVPYGQPVPASEIPELAQRESHYGFWQEKGQDAVTRNLKIEAEYRLWVTSVESDLNEQGLPVLLAEGEFYPGTELHVTEATDKSYTEGFPNLVKAYRYELSAPDLPDNGNAAWNVGRLRILTKGLEGKKPFYVLFVTEEPADDSLGDLYDPGSRRDGSYLLADASRVSGVIMVLDHSDSLVTPLVLTLLFAVAGAGVWYGIRRKKRQGHNREE